MQLNFRNSATVKTISIAQEKEIINSGLTAKSLRDARPLTMSELNSVLRFSKNDADDIRHAYQKQIDSALNGKTFSLAELEKMQNPDKLVKVSALGNLALIDVYGFSIQNQTRTGKTVHNKYLILIEKEKKANNTGKKKETKETPPAVDSNSEPNTIQ